MSFRHGYALLIGVDESREAGLALPGVGKDVAALRAVLVHEGRCGYVAGQVRVVTGQEATRAGILDGLDWLAEQVDGNAEATAVVYYSGHGARVERARGGERFYLLPYDVDTKRLRASALEAEVLADAIAGLGPQRLLVVLDCCHAGGMEVKGVPGAAQFGRAAQYTRAALPVGLLLGGEEAVAATELAAAKGLEEGNGLAALRAGHGRAVLSSSQGSEESYMRKDGAMSVFTYHLIEALTGHAQPAGGATEVLVSDVVGHVYRRVPGEVAQMFGKAQHPDFALTGNFPVALLLGGKGLAKGGTAPEPLAPLPTTPSTLSATNRGSGAIAQGPGAVAAGERGVAIGGGVSGSTIVTGDGNRVDNSSSVFDQRGQHVGGSQTNIKGDLNTGGGLANFGSIDTGGGSLSGRDSTVRGVDVAELMQVIGALMQAVMQASNPERSGEALAKVQAIQAEAQKGDKADDSRLAGLVDDLVKLVPGAVSAVVSAFGTPILAGVVGPVTGYVLGKVRGEL